jgi:predicted dinucleotide-binding enzyme
MATGAKVVNTFNSTFAAVMHSPSRTFSPQKAAGFYYGDDDSAKAVVSGLIKETGLRASGCWTSDVRQIS